jgi:release factor glutamine methyltransferase
MLSYNDAFYSLKDDLQAIYDPQESAAIAHELLLHLTGKDRSQRLLEKDATLSHGEQKAYDIMKADLLNGKPLQYVTGTAWFLGQPYTVNENVLIPRPETEELVQWIAGDHQGKKVSILDIGTGSGCIPIALSRLLPDAGISACDISNAALRVASRNAHALGANVSFYELDILDRKSWIDLPHFDIIVSNPPYIPLSEKEQLAPNVRDHEPATALFVPNEDVLIFYKAIAEFGNTHLNNGGSIYCELHQDLYLRTESVFNEAGYEDVQLKKDMHGNWRMLKAQK